MVWCLQLGVLQSTRPNWIYDGETGVNVEQKKKKWICTQIKFSRFTQYVSKNLNTLTQKCCQDRAEYWVMHQGFFLIILTAHTDSTSCFFQLLCLELVYLNAQINIKEIQSIHKLASSYLELSTIYCTILSRTLSKRAVRTQMCLMAWAERGWGTRPAEEPCLRRVSCPLVLWVLLRICKIWKEIKLIVNQYDIIYSLLQ